MAAILPVPPRSRQALPLQGKDMPADKAGGKAEDTQLRTA
jgi:hypothetical protein